MNVLGFKWGRITDPDGIVHDEQTVIQRAINGAQVLAYNDVQPSDRVILSHGNNAAFFSDLLSIWLLGACAVCVNPLLSLSELRNIVKFVDPKLLIAGDPSESDLSIPILRKLWEYPAREFIHLPLLSHIRLDSEALVLFTSGTTGTPKGVVLNFRGLFARLSINQHMIGETTLQKSLCPLPTHFGHGLIGNCLSALTCGADLFIYPINTVNASVSIGEYIDEHEITFMSSVPSLWRMITRFSPRPKKNSLKRVNVGSETLPASLWEEIIEWCGNRNVANMYGITESANWIGGASARDYKVVDGLVGPVWMGNALVKTGKESCAYEGRGEIMIQTPSIMTGYLNQPTLSENVLRGGYLLTGDLGEIDESGCIRILGRKKYEINRAGIKINPEELDSLLVQSNLVSDACAFSIPDEVTGELVGIAIVVDEEQGAPSISVTKLLDQIKPWLKKRLVEDKHPDKWFIVKEIKRTDRGKMDRDQVSKDCLDLKHKH